MSVRTFCDRCGMEYTHAGVRIGDRVYCCAGCASGGPCTCRQPDVVVTQPGDTVIVDDDEDVIVV